MGKLMKKLISTPVLSKEQFKRIENYRLVNAYLHAVGEQQYKILSYTLTQIMVFCIVIQKTFKLQ